MVKLQNPRPAAGAIKTQGSQNKFKSRPEEHGYVVPVGVATCRCGSAFICIVCVCVCVCVCVMSICNVWCNYRLEGSA